MLWLKNFTYVRTNQQRYSPKLPFQMFRWYSAAFLHYIELDLTAMQCDGDTLVWYTWVPLVYIALNSLLTSVFGCFTGALHCTVMASSTSTRTDRWHCFQLNVTRRGWALSRNCTGLDSKKGGKEEQNYMSWLKQEVKLEVGNFG